MLAEVTKAKNFLVSKFGSVENIKPGSYAIPTETSKGDAFMRVIINAEMGMSSFELFLDEELTKSWY